MLKLLLTSDAPVTYSLELLCIDVEAPPAPSMPRRVDNETTVPVPLAALFGCARRLDLGRAATCPKFSLTRLTCPAGQATIADYSGSESHGGSAEDGQSQGLAR